MEYLERTPVCEGVALGVTLQAIWEGVALPLGRSAKLTLYTNCSRTLGWNWPIKGHKNRTTKTFVLDKIRRSTKSGRAAKERVFSHTIPRSRSDVRERDANVSGEKRDCEKDEP